ncbi:class F sortase [Candidatus Parcubacteria bacterium]|nr:class F sortase [Candidatus Parcubacteria bacterium]
MRIGIVFLLSLSLYCIGVGTLSEANIPLVVEVPTAKAQEPLSLKIPAIALDAPIVEVGTNEKGEMDVPDGATGAVGWYKYGTAPGEKGSAVLDAHVYAAFKKLKNLQTGDSLSVGGKHFVVTDSIVYRLQDLPMDFIFTRNDGVYLNLITCEGSFDNSRSTYDKRRVVYAKLAE